MEFDSIEDKYMIYLDEMAILPDIRSATFINELIDMEILKLVRGDVVNLSDDPHTLNTRNLTLEEFSEKCANDSNYSTRFVQKINKITK